MKLARVSQIAAKHSPAIRRSTIYEWVARGECPAIRVGKVILIPEDEFEAWLASRIRGGDRVGA